MDAFFKEPDELNRRTIRCAPYPGRWEKFAKKYKLSWSLVPFMASKRKAVSNKKGIYCFLVAHDWKSLPPVGYALYVGSVGLSKNKASRRSLQERYGEYLREIDDEKGRYHVRYFLKVFKGELIFMYAEAKLARAKLKEMENALNDALMPPFSRRDFSARVAAQRNAWQ